MQKSYFLTAILLLTVVYPASAVTVSNLQEFQAATSTLKPGDELVMANGVWRDVELTFTGKGTAEKPITLRSEEAGRVILSGESNLRISGEYLVVSGLIFKDGFTPTSEVISFRTSKNDLANHVRVTNTVIDDFSNPERHDNDTWVAIYGKNNRFDHNSLINKGNRGVTLAVKLRSEASRENNHIVEYNYFGPRQTLGSNGGETLRIGTSHYSRKFSNTIVRNNFFDRTSGELEIISSKSCGNEISDNVFFESQGTLTMRHGHTTLVKNNYFLGNRVPNTGGIRIINEYQTVKNNYLYGLTGHRFRGALVIMNGVPNSPPNRYNQVVGAKMNNNIVVHSDHIQLCAGSDSERSAVPVGSSMQNNIFMSNSNTSPFTIYDDISGISFSGNVINKEANIPFKEGFTKVPYQLEKNEHGLMVPEASLIDEIGFGEVKLPVTKEEVGASYYPKVGAMVEFQSGKKILVPQGEDSLLNALATSHPGDTLILENGGEYLLRKYAVIKHPITIKTISGRKATVHSSKASFFIINNGGSLELENLRLDGAESPDQPGNNVISTSRYSMNRNYSLSIRNVKVTNMDVNHSFDFLKVYRNTFADKIEIVNTEMLNVTGSILALNKETDDLGIYNVENLNIRDSNFSDIQGPIADVYRGGTDESTFGPIIKISGNKFKNVGMGTRNKSGASLKFHGVQNLKVSDSTWENSAPIDLFLTNGEPITSFENLRMRDTAEIRSNNADFDINNVTHEGNSK